MPKFPIDYSNEKQLRNAFSWLTRYGMGHKFGTLSIAWYQQHQCNALDVIQYRLGDKDTVGEVRVMCQKERDSRGNKVYRLLARTKDNNGRWWYIGSCYSVWRAADNKCRQ